MFFHKYPYTDSHELNLDWVLEQIEALKHPPIFEIPITWDENDDPQTTVTPNEYNQAVKDAKKGVITWTSDGKEYMVPVEPITVDGMNYPDMNYHMDPYTNTFFWIHFEHLGLDDPFTVYFDS